MATSTQISRTTSDLSRGIRPTTRTTFLFAFVLTLAGMVVAQDEPAENPYAEQSGKLASETKVVFAKTSSAKVEMQPKAVFHYDDQPRRILDGRLWLWNANGRPVAMQKVEYATSQNVPVWTHCIASFAPQPITVSWPGRRDFTTNKAGFEPVKLPELPAPGKTAVQIRQQTKRLAERITAKIESLPGRSNVETMRLLPKAITEYESPDEQIRFGVIYAFASNGTNPDMFAVVEALDDSPRKGPPWNVGFVRMTTGGLDVSIDETPVWSAPYINEPEKHLGNWQFFHFPASK